MSVVLVTCNGERVPAYHFDCGKIIRQQDGAEVDPADVLDLMRGLSSEAQSLRHWGRLDTSLRFCADALSLHEAWERYQADRAGMAAARAMLRRRESVARAEAAVKP